MSKIHAEISIIPIGTKSTSVSEYISKAVSSLKNVKDIRYQVTAMGTEIEAESLEKIFEALKKMSDTVFETGIARTYTVLKIDERHDKDNNSLEHKVKSIDF